MRWKSNLLSLIAVLFIATFSFAGGDDPWPLMPAPIDGIDISVAWAPEDGSRTVYIIDKYMVTTSHMYIKVTEHDSETGLALSKGSSIIHVTESEADIKMNGTFGVSYPLRLVSFYEDETKQTIGLGISIFDNKNGKEKHSFLLRKKYKRIGFFKN